MEKVVIYGNRSVARDFYFCLKYYSSVHVAGFAVDRELIDSDTLFGVPVVAFDDVVKTFPPETHCMFIAVGYVQNNKIRKDRYDQAKALGYRLMNFVSPTAILHPETPLGDNAFIGHYAVISEDAKIGSNVVVGPASVIGHDVVVGDHCFLSAGVSIAGGVQVGECCFLGMRSVIRNKVSIGRECVVGAGAILLADADDNSVFLGEPATLLPIASNNLPLG